MPVKKSDVIATLALVVSIVAFVSPYIKETRHEMSENMRAEKDELSALVKSKIDSDAEYFTKSRDLIPTKSKELSPLQASQIVDKLGDLNEIYSRRGQLYLQRATELANKPEMRDYITPSEYLELADGNLAIGSYSQAGTFYREAIEGISGSKNVEKGNPEIQTLAHRAYAAFCFNRARLYHRMVEGSSMRTDKAKWQSLYQNNIQIGNYEYSQATNMDVENPIRDALQAETYLNWARDLRDLKDAKYLNLSRKKYALAANFYQRSDEPDKSLGLKAVADEKALIH